MPAAVATFPCPRGPSILLGAPTHQPQPLLIFPSNFPPFLIPIPLPKLSALRAFAVHLSSPRGPVILTGAPIHPFAPPIGHFGGRTAPVARASCPKPPSFGPRTGRCALRTCHFAPHAAHEIAEALAGWFEDNGREGDAAQIDLSLNAWQRLRDTALIAKARLLHQKLTAALASDADGLATHGLTPADATLLAKETDDFERITADPSAAISRRRALTLALRPKFREVSELLRKMDRLVLRFRRTQPGAAFVAAWQASRIVRDLGSSAPATPQPTPPTP